MSNEERISWVNKERKKTVSVNEAIKLTGKSRRTINYWLSQNKVRSIKFGMNRYILQEDLHRLNKGKA